MNWGRVFYGVGIIVYQIEAGKTFAKTNKDGYLSLHAMQEIGKASLFWPINISYNYYNKAKQNTT